MSNQETKACSLTEDEIEALIIYHGSALRSVMLKTDSDHKIERINYLHRRLKATKKTEAAEDNISSETVKQPEAKGWGNG